MPFCGLQCSPMTNDLRSPPLTNDQHGPTEHLCDGSRHLCIWNWCQFFSPLDRARNKVWRQASNHGGKYQNGNCEFRSIWEGEVHILGIRGHLTFSFGLYSPALSLFIGLIISTLYPTTSTSTIHNDIDVKIGGEADIHGQHICEVQRTMWQQRGGSREG